MLGAGISVPFALRVPSALESGGYFNISSESTRVDHVLSQKLHQPLSRVAVVFQSASAPAGDPVFQAEVNAFVARVRSLPNLTQIMPGDVGQDGRTTFVVVGFGRDADPVERQMPAFRLLLPAPSAALPARAYLIGTPAIYDQLTVVSDQDVEHSDALALPVALLAPLLAGRGGTLPGAGWKSTSQAI